MDYNNIGMNKRIRLAIVFSVGALIVGCGFLTFFSIKNNSNKTRTIKNNIDVTMTSVHLENGEINPDVFYTDSNNGGTIEISNDYFSLDLEKIETQNYSYEIKEIYMVYSFAPSESYKSFDFIFMGEEKNYSLAKVDATAGVGSYRLDFNKFIEFKTVKFCVGLKDVEDDSIISTSSEMKNIRFLVFGEYNYAWNFRKI